MPSSKKKSEEKKTNCTHLLKICQPFSDVLMCPWESASLNCFQMDLRVDGSLSPISQLGSFDVWAVCSLSINNRLKESFRFVTFVPQWVTEDLICLDFYEGKQLFSAVRCQSPAYIIHGRFTLSLIRGECVYWKAKWVWFWKVCLRL